MNRSDDLDTVMSEELRVLRTLADGARAGEVRALATIIRTRGSTPRKEGARMVVGKDGGVLAGTVGGGCGEGEVLQAAALTLRDGRTRTISIDLTRELISLSPAVCGGVMEVRVEQIPGGGEGPGERP